MSQASSTPPVEFENGVFTLETHQIFSVHKNTPAKFENATIAGRFRFVFEGNSGREITWLSLRHRFRNAPFSKCFPSTLKHKAGVFKFLRFKERVDGRPNHRNRAAFSNSSGVEWTRP